MDADAKRPEGGGGGLKIGKILRTFFIDGPFREIFI